MKTASVKKPDQISKHRRYRRSVKAQAIRIKGGRCEACGFADERALRLHHIKPVRRGLNGMRKQALSSTETHRAVARGHGKDVRLLCANCSTIITARDWTLNVNIARKHDVTR